MLTQVLRERLLEHHLAAAASILWCAAVDALAGLPQMLTFGLTVQQRAASAVKEYNKKRHFAFQFTQSCSISYSTLIVGLHKWHVALRRPIGCGLCAIQAPLLLIFWQRLVNRQDVFIWSALFQSML